MVKSDYIKTQKVLFWKTLFKIGNVNQNWELIHNASIFKGLVYEIFKNTITMADSCQCMAKTITIL